MRSHVKKHRSTRSARRLSITTVLVALAIVAVGAVTVVSRQSLSDKASAKSSQQSFNNATTQSVAPSTQEDKDKLAEGLKQMINQSTEGLTEIHHTNGSVSINLDDRFQNVTVVKDTDGRLSQSCVDNPEAAGAFFNIDPKLIDNKSRALVTR